MRRHYGKETLAIVLAGILALAVFIFWFSSTVRRLSDNPLEGSSWQALRQQIESRYRSYQAQRQRAKELYADFFTADNAAEPESQATTSGGWQYQGMIYQPIINNEQ